MTIKRLIAIICILIAAALGWVILAASLQIRTAESTQTLGRSVAGSWGPPMTQQHPTLYYLSPNRPNGHQVFQPGESAVKVKLNYEPKKKGLLWNRTYLVNFAGEYTFENPTPITQTIYIQFRLPSKDATYNHFSFLVNGKPTTEDSKAADGITQAVTLEPGQTGKLSIGYETRGTDRWGYAFGESTRVRRFNLQMDTDFDKIDFPNGTASPTKRAQQKDGWAVVWDYPDVIGAMPIAMEMPGVLNPGPVASRIAFFAPVSLVFFFAVVLIMATVWQVNLHPMNYFFLAAGLFAFHLLFAYLVDLIPLTAAFVVAALVSMLLVSGYLFIAAGKSFARLAAAAQFAYLVLFSYSFFFEGLTGLTITLGAIVTLAILMVTTAKVNWAEKFTLTPVPPVNRL